MNSNIVFVENIVSELYKYLYVDICDVCMCIYIYVCVCVSFTPLPIYFSVCISAQISFL